MPARLDAFSLSFDQAVPIDPLERLKVSRGAAALFYGGSAAGAVVNAIDNRIPKARIDGVAGALEARIGSAARFRPAGSGQRVPDGGCIFRVGSDSSLLVGAVARRASRPSSATRIRLTAIERQLHRRADIRVNRRPTQVSVAAAIHGGNLNGCIQSRVDRRFTADPRDRVTTLERTAILAQ